MLAILDRVDPREAPGEDPPFREQDLQKLTEIPGVEEDLVAVAGDDEVTPVRRYAAVEALLDGRFSKWRSSSSDSRAVAKALAVAMRNDTAHNRWGLPGQFTGRLGDRFLSLPDGVLEALIPLLDDLSELHLEGSEEVVLQSAAHYRIADLAAYLLSLYRGLPWAPQPNVARRDAAIAALRTSLQK